MTVPTRAVAPEQLGELHRQVDLLVAKGYPALAGLTNEDFRAQVTPLEDSLPAEPFVLVVTGALVPRHRLIELTALDGRAGFTTMDAADVARFTPTPDVELPASPVYLITDVDTGSAALGVRPKDALPHIYAAERTPLTLDEGLAVVTQHPEWLRERNCFEMLGSRAGDKRVTGLWLSKGAPRLGWCWMGNPHTILQSYAQGVAVWGETGMKALWSAATVKVIGPGIDDASLRRRPLPPHR